MVTYKSLGTHKRGDTFSRYVDITDTATGDPVEVDITTMHSQIRTSGDSLISILTISQDAEVPGRYYLIAGDTTLWPITDLLLDIEFTLNGQVVSTETCQVTIVRDITHE